MITEHDKFNYNYRLGKLVSVSFYSTFPCRLLVEEAQEGEEESSRRSGG